MSNLSAFLRQNQKVEENLKLVVTKRYPIVDDKGKPVLDADGNQEYPIWEFRKLDAKENVKCRNNATHDIPVEGKRGVKQPKLDFDEYMTNMIVESCIYPDLKAKELQDDWGVRGAGDLLMKLLNGGEYDNLILKVKDYQGYDETLEDKKEQAKN